MSLYTPDTGYSSGFSYTVSAEATQELLLAYYIIDRMNLTTESDEEEVITNQIKAVRAYLEKKLGMSLVASKTITAEWETYGTRTMLPFHPVQSVTSVSIVEPWNGTETAQTVSNDYWVQGQDKKSIVMKQVYAGYGLKVVYVTGITDSAIKELVKDAIMSEVIEWFHQRNNPDENQYILGKIALSKLDTLRVI